MQTCGDCRFLQIRSRRKEEPWGFCEHHKYSPQDGDGIRCDKFESLHTYDIKLELERLNLKLSAILAKLGDGE